MGIRIASVALALLAGCRPAPPRAPPPARPPASAPEDAPDPRQPFTADPVPVPVPSDPDGVAEVDRAAISAAVRAHIRDIQACYENELKANPGLTGKVVTQFLLVQHGERTVRITHSEVESSTLEPAIGRCIVDALRFVEFKGHLDEDVSVSFPFVFSPSTD